MYFSEKSTADEYTKEGENICPPSKIIYNLAECFWHWSMLKIFINTMSKVFFKTNIQDTNIIVNMFWKLVKCLFKHDVEITNYK